MEKQKIFWVVLSVSVFVVVVLVAGVFLLNQKPTAASPPPRHGQPHFGSGTQVYEYQREVSSGARQSGGGPQVQRFYIGEGAPGSSSSTLQRRFARERAAPVPAGLRYPAVHGSAR